LKELEEKEVEMLNRFKVTLSKEQKMNEMLE
jgi:hypothetical protein